MAGGVGQIVDIPIGSQGSWLKESQITASSQPFLRVIFNPYEQDITLRQVAHKSIITAAEIEGKTKVSRKGRIDIVDPDGVWPERLTKVGFITNHFTGLRLPNIKVEFGWTNVLMTGGRNSYAVESLDGLITKVEFDITAEGITKAVIHFIETVTEVISTIRILDPNDIKFFYDNKLSFDKMIISEKLKWLFNSRNFAFAKQLYDNGIYLTFEPTADDNDSKMDIDWGDFIVKKINQLTAKAKRPNDQEKKETEHTNAVYEKKGAPIEIGTISSSDGRDIPLVQVSYGWVETPDENATKEDQKRIWATAEYGPTLYWKKSFNPSEGKKIIDWSSDLSSHGHLIHQAQSELTKKLTQFAEEDWKFVNQQVRNKGTDYTNVDKNIWEHLFGTGEDYDNRVKAVEEFQTVIESVTGIGTGSVNNQLRAILMQNVFKATAKIMGDPYYGTQYEAFKVQFLTDFGSDGFPSLFKRNWLLTNIKHIFSEGSYITELQLLAYPDPGYDKRQKIQALLNEWEARGNTLPQWTKDYLLSSAG